MRNFLNILRAFGIEIDWLRLRLRIPLATIEQLLTGKLPKGRFVLAAQAPGIQVSGQIPAVGARICFAARIEVEGIGLEQDRRTLTIRIRELSLGTSDDSVGPLAETIRRGAIDTSRPADLIGNQLALPTVIVSAAGERVVIDLLRLPAFGKGLRRALFLVGSTMLCITGVTTNDRFVELRIGLFPARLGGFMRALVRHALVPALNHISSEPGGSRT